MFKTNFKHNFLLKYMPKRTKLLYISCLFIGKMPWKPINIYHIVLYLSLKILIKIFTKTNQIAHFSKNFSQGSKPPRVANSHAYGVILTHLTCYSRTHAIDKFTHAFKRNHTHTHAFYKIEHNLLFLIM